MLNSLRYLGFTDFSEIERMTVYEYDIRMTAYRLATVDRKHEIHMQAWANNEIKSVREIGKKTIPVYDRFDKFFDYEAEENKVFGISKTDERLDTKLMNLMKEANS